MSASDVSMGTGASGARRRALLQTLLWGGAGVTAVGLGAAAWWQWRAPADSLSELWSLELATPQGGILRLADWKGRALIVNFWATWCAPCLQEMPMLDRFRASPQGLPVLGLAADRIEPVSRFLQRLPVGFPIGVLPPGGLDLTRRLGNAGGLPFSLLIDASGNALVRKSGQLHEDELSAWRRQV